jgi:hypothetical protein
MAWWKKSKGDEVVDEAEEITRQAAKDRKDKDDKDGEK